MNEWEKTWIGKPDIWGRGFCDELCIMRADADIMKEDIEWNTVQ